LLEDKRQAIDKAAEVKGVRIVVSHIRVETEKVPDGLLLEQLRERLAQKENAQIKLKVKKGVVTIQGTAQHDAHRESLLSTVASTSGVVGMKDNLKVMPDWVLKNSQVWRRIYVSKLDDEWIQNEVFRSSIDIPQETRAQVVDLLNLRLADAIDLKMQAEHAHWNAKGKEFFALHQLGGGGAIDADEVPDLSKDQRSLD